MSGPTIIPDSSGSDLAAPPRNRWLRRALRLAGNMKTGTLTFVMPDGAHHRVGTGDAPAATVTLDHPAAIRRLVAGGRTGLAEAYIDGLWDSPDLREVMAVATANEAGWEQMPHRRPWARAMSGVAAAFGSGVASDIIAEHDLDHDFYASWLDPAMLRSAAWFSTPDDTLDAAQQHKVHRMCRMLRLSPGMRLLDIGCGWGGFAEVAARDYGVSVLGIAASPAQLDHARARMKRAGLSSRVELRPQALRDVTGSFDRIVTIEHVETIGEKDWPDYFDMIRVRLRQNGVAGLQVVTIPERLFGIQGYHGDFVRRHIAGDSVFPSKSRLKKAIAQARLAWGEEFWFGRDYARTLACWQARFQAAWPRIAADTVLNRRPCDERFRRSWAYYLAGREAEFRAGWADVGQILIARND